MRRILIALVMSGAVVVAAPSTSMAQRHHSRHHHARHHARHRSTRNSRRERFGHWDQNGSARPAGSVAMFTDNGDGTGVLTLTINGNAVTGNVTNDTQLECTSANSAQQGDDNGDNDGNGDDNANGGDDNANGGDNSASDDGGGNGDDNGGNDGNGDGDDGGQMCSTASLTPGTMVADAVLEFTSSGAVWQKVELITS